MENVKIGDGSDAKSTLVLPHELSEKILEFLSPSDLSRFSMCCIEYRELANSNHLWLHHCMVKGWLKYGVSSNILQEVPLFSRGTNILGNSPLFTLFVPEKTRLSPICQWKHIFLRMTHLNKNWARGRYNVLPILRGHNDKVTCMDCQDYTIVSGSQDKQIKVWDVQSCCCVRTIRGHTDTVTAVKLKGRSIITGCADSAVRVFDMDTGKIIQSFQGHGGSVDHIVVLDNLIVTAATDRSLRVWSLTAGVLVHTLREHDDDIECLVAFGRHVMSGSWDNTLVLWSVDEGKMLLKLRGHTEAVVAVQFDEKKAVSGSADGDVRVWSLMTGECTHVLSSGQADMEVYCVVYNKVVIASGSSDSVVRIWSHDGRLLHELHEHLGVVRCLHINDERLVSGGDQKKVVIWDYREGKVLKVAHRHPTRLRQMWVGDTRLVTASPDTPGTLTVLSFW
ncbi:F-box/WD repeat-containing protein 7-like isoform X2 [Pomacea canaliculata]|nr:F-box/WD repeat-containing protein 7-like isoform X2 [Pomacea canaliculata]XP_025105941.1 F-box/WD repeat-containing protein 7-like isoform X2 [Pomacea canaliculata]XP_025105942.1 F-box/WD repeat-containing protein 7-like isoform X2 [Pomacea canaliculata]